MWTQRKFFNSINTETPFETKTIFAERVYRRGHNKIFTRNGPIGSKVGTFDAEDAPGNLTEDVRESRVAGKGSDEDEAVDDNAEKHPAVRETRLPSEPSERDGDVEERFPVVVDAWNGEGDSSSCEDDTNESPAAAFPSIEAIRQIIFGEHSSEGWYASEVLRAEPEAVPGRSSEDKRTIEPNVDSQEKDVTAEIANKIVWPSSFNRVQFGRNNHVDQVAM